MCDHNIILSQSSLRQLWLMGAASASADTFYFYTGNLYTDVTGSYTTSMKVTGFIDLVTPLGDNFGSATIVHYTSLFQMVFKRLRTRQPA